MHTAIVVSSTVCMYACTVLPRNLTRLQYVRRNAWTLLNSTTRPMSHRQSSVRYCKVLG
jgi:hypothetical protein